ncbi:endo-1,4-beta-xylanase [Acinetobacter soli]|uniref:endo-1,4-beta-xylanase n=1 Tax=Acinetobacter soli TaxID=487316 RepID=UPI001F2BDC07|nr:endo-1,4-beta-xylanase [Acinetobacter soli]MCE6008133.1 endo-1,4-beta-xylanase [Acinetobacter soli]
MKEKFFFILILIINIISTSRAENTTIASLAKNKKINFGFAINYDQLHEDKLFREIIKNEASIIVPTNALKWKNLNPEPNVYNFNQADYIVDFAVKNKIKVRGHTLVWHNQIPNYILENQNPIEAKKILKAHINLVVSRYKNKIESWDVVNEVINPSDKKPNGLRNSYWYKMLGEQYIDIAFHQAHEADPNAILVYNEWGVEYDTKWSEEKRRYVLDLIKLLKSNQVPISGFGIQSHLSTNGIKLVNQQLIEFIKEIEKLGLKVYITELDIKKNNNGSISNAYAKYINIILDKTDIKDIIIWGVTDKKINSNNQYPYLIFDKNKNENENYNSIKKTFEKNLKDR